ncbi:MAG: hypothetical protein UX13_C0044G0007 [Candidatus Woesebacteria bacterium GW2011_GWB1_45_5]|uniref:Uncharacterized protein n=1 Tax=Candidatus Woesebacteria bacterium GW2011_GWB1_45_5 TaxID=1618581 RepID=A0A0G1PUZ0_9BACT|nr:MAG: hypothetical protein UX13_C0044G0007 [Candidatus Woesebacteria bacterium GW2011_GWB1_45_5]
MRKELIWAGIVGITFGLVIAFGAWRINSSLKTKPPSTEATPLPEQNSELKIALAKPENDDVVTEDSVTVSGITKPLAWVTLSAEEDDYVVRSEQSGVFEEEVGLIPGVNQIKITAFDPEGNKSTEKVLVVFSSSFKEKSVPTPTPGANATEESDIKQKVAQTTVANTTKGTNKTVKLTDIAIGDFIVAMGYVNGNSVLVSQRILIADPVTEPKLNASMGLGKDVTTSKNTLVFLFNEGEVTKSKAVNIGDGDKVIYVIEEVKEKSSTRTVFVVQ